MMKTVPGCVFLFTSNTISNQDDGSFLYITFIAVNNHQLMAIIRIEGAYAHYRISVSRSIRTVHGRNRRTIT